MFRKHPSVHSRQQARENQHHQPQRRQLRRRLTCERLDARRLLAADAGWTFHLSGPGDSRVHDLEIDTAGDLFISGRADGLTDLDPGPDTANVGTNTGIDQAFVAKYSSEGALLWYKAFDVGSSFGGSDSTQREFQIELDSQQNVVLAGEFHVPTLTIDGQSLELEGESSLFIARLSGATSQAQSVLSVGGVGGEIYFRALDVDDQDRIHVGGGFGGEIDFDPTQATAMKSSLGAIDGFVSSMAADGSLLSVQTLVSSQLHRIWSISADSSGNLVYGGFFRGAATLTDGQGSTTALDSGSDFGAFIAKSSNGELQWVTEVTGTVENMFPNVIAANDGSQYVAIGFQGEISVANNVHTTRGSRDLLVGELDASGKFDWTTQVGGPGFEDASGLMVGEGNGLVLSGNYSDGATFGEGETAVSLAAPSGIDSYLARFDDSGSRLNVGPFASAAGKRSLVIDSSGNTWVSGGFMEEATFFSGETFVPVGIDGFLSRINAGYLPPEEEVLFEDSFENGATSNDWNDKWTEDAQNDWFRSSQRATVGSVSAEVDGNADNATLTLANPIDLTGHESVQLSFDWLIESGFDSGEYIAVDAWDGSTWTELARRSGNVDAENVWESKTVSIDSSMASADFRIRFRAEVSRYNEDANVDNVRITGIASGNQAPNANAGVDQILSDDDGSGRETTTLTGSGTDSDGTIVAYEWKDGETILGTTESISPTLSVGTHILTFTATDNGGASDSDTVVVTVNGNVAPSADGGQDKSVADEDANGSEVVTLIGSGSDSDGSIIGYEWKEGETILGTSASISPTLAVGTHTLTFTVTDNGGSSTSDTVVVTVNEATSGPNLSHGDLASVGNDWQTITLDRSYSSMVVVATPRYNAGSGPGVVRINNVTSNSFDVRVDNAGATAFSGGVHFVAVEEGVYDEPGFKLEAVKYSEAETSRKNGWLIDSVSYQQSYTNPVVVGQVMSANDPDWSVFWASSNSRTSPPTSSQLNVGKHVAEDPDATRAAETVGYIVIEATQNGTIEGLPFVAGVGGDSVRGVDNGTYQYNYTAMPNAKAAILSSAGMDGNDGGWAVLQGSNPLPPAGGTIALAIDEDQLGDSERNHTTEQVAYFVIDPPGQGDPMDVNGDSKVTAADALRVINRLVRTAQTSAESAGDLESLDVNQDGVLSALDALVVINRLSRQPATPAIAPIATTEAVDAVFTVPSDEDEEFESVYQLLETTGLID